MSGPLTLSTIQGKNQKTLLAIPITILATLIIGIIIGQSQSYDSSLLYAFLLIFAYLPIGVLICYMVGKRFNSAGFLVPTFVAALVLRHIVSLIFYFNHDALVATGLRDDIAYFEAGLRVARMISEQGPTVLFDLTTIFSTISLDSWAFYYFDALHFLIFPSLLLPVTTLAVLSTLSGLFLYVIAHLLDLGERVARYAYLLWLFSPAAIGWAAINHKESLLVPAVLTCIWAMYTKRNFVLRVMVLAFALVLLAGLRWYIGLMFGLLFLAKTLVDITVQRRSISRSIVLIALSILILINVTSLIPRYELQLQSPEATIGLFSDIQEKSWEQTGTEKAFGSAVRARAISPILGYMAVFFAFFFTPPPTQWLGIQEFRVLGTLLFIALLVYSVWGVTYLWRKDRVRYWALILPAILVPALLAGVPTLIGSRHRLQVEPLFILLGVVGFVRTDSRLIHLVSILIIVGTILFTSAVDIFF